ncbi:hypothetical protein F5Y08DRAFT_258264 [Xylaria arbuscula]|nr:hypothetical protein F5Y08DRAFT_258264 [Xylaria arbuscula]
MRSISVAAAAALLAGMSAAQPARHHGHQHLHAKRELVTEWETVWETVTVLVDESTTETLYPAHTESGAPGQFYETPTTTSSTPESTPTVETSTSTQAPPPPPTTTAQSTTSTSSSSTPPPAPTTTSTSTPEPVPEPETSTYEAPAETTTTAAAETTPVSSGGSSGGSSGSADYSYQGVDGAFGTSSLDSKDYSGDITYYAPGLGACGYTDSESSLIVALSVDDWAARGSGTNSGVDQPNHPWCNQMITITAANGNTATAKVHDKCPGCASGSIDVTEPIFMQLFGSLSGGRETMTWTFNN